MPSHQTTHPVEALVLAAGLSARMGRSKALLRWGQTTILRHICQVLLASGLDVTVVLGHQGRAVAQTLAGLSLASVTNPNYESGEMLSSLQVGLKELAEGRASACLIVLGDQPAIQSATIDLVLNAYHTQERGIVRPVYEGQSGHPLIFDRRYWPEIQKLPPDSVPRKLVRAHRDDLLLLEVDTPSVVQAVDTPEAYQRALREQELGDS